MSDAYRDAPARPAALVALCEAARRAGSGPPPEAWHRPAGERADDLPREAARLSAARRGFRLALACDLVAYEDNGREAGRIGAVGAAVSAGALAAGVVPAAIFAAVFGAMTWRAARPDYRVGPSSRIDDELATVDALPFAVRGYADWLASRTPLFDVHLTGAVDARLVVDATAALRRDATADWLDARTFRVGLPPRKLRGGTVGDRAAWARYAAEVLLPLASDVGVARVEMGGKR